MELTNHRNTTMNEAQTLLAIENLMKKVMKKSYHWQDLDSELDFYNQNLCTRQK